MKTLLLTVGKRTIEVADLKQASDVYSLMREKSGHGASRFPEGQLFDAKGVQTHYVSYNGKVWPGTKYIMGGVNVPAYNPYEEV